ncbi:MAG: succinylglutamate desuccinylase/aspartoacylase family protein [Pseudomonadota bacterium]
MKQALIIGGVEIAPGTRRHVDLALPPLYTHSTMSMPVHVINGRRDGPRLFVSAGIHGDEINGVEIIRRLLSTKALSRMHGALIAVPVVNVYGFVSRSRYLPDRRDLNRFFPGSETGSMASRLAELFTREVVDPCTHGIDLHTAAIGRDNLPQIRAALDAHPDTEAMACAFGAPVVIDSSLREGSLRASMADLGKPVLLYEAGEALRFDEVSIRAGVKGILRVMRAIGMLPKQSSKRRGHAPLISKDSVWMRAPQSGVLRAQVPLGAQVDVGDTLGVVADTLGESEAMVASEVAGIVIGKTNLPLVHEGEAVFHVACFRSPDSAAQAVEAFQEEHQPLDGEGEINEPPLV